MHDISYACQMIMHEETGLICRRWCKYHVRIVKKRIEQHKLTWSNVVMGRHGIHDEKQASFINQLSYTDLNMLWELYNATD